MMRGRAREELSRLHFRQRGGRRARASRISLGSHDDLDRRHGRSRAGWRDRGCGRHVSNTSTTATGSSIWKTSATPRIPGSRIAPRSTPRSSRRTTSYSDGSGEIAIRQMRQNGAPYSFWESQVGIWTYPNGHSYLGDYHDDAKLVAAMNDPVFRDYIAALEAKKGKDRDAAHPRSAALEQQCLSEPLVHEPVPAVARHASHRGQSHRSAHLLFPAERRAGADVPATRSASPTSSTAPARWCSPTISKSTIASASGLSSEGAEWIEIGRGYQSDGPADARRPQGQELDQRGLHPQHVRRLARLHDQPPRRNAAASYA